MDILKFGLKYWKKYLPMAIFCQIMGFIALGAAVLLPQLIQLIIDFVIDYKPQNADHLNNIFSFLLNGNYGNFGEFSLFISIATVFVILLIFKITLIYIRNNLFIRNGLKLENDLRDATYKKLISQSSNVLARYSTGDLLNVLNGDIISFKELFAFVFLVIADAIYMLIILIILLSQVSWFMVIIPLAISPFLVYTLGKFIRAARDISGDIRNKNAEMNMNVSENINAVRLVRSFANENIEIEKFEKKNQNIKNTYFRHADIISRFTVFFNIFRQVAVIGSTTIGTLLIFNGLITVGAMVAFSGYVINIMDNISNINNFMFTAQQYLVSGGRIMVFLETGIIIDNPLNPLKMENNPYIKTENLTLSIDDHVILKNVNLDIPFGKKVGIMGGTGSGKTMLLKVLSRFYDATSGMVLINGHNIKNYNLEDIRKQYSFVFQDVFLFSNTIDANIAYYDPDASRELVVEMAKKAQALDFIEKMPDGFDTVIGERGFGLSGGQKQRVSIARALLKNAPVLVLDDSTSALDMHTEKHLLNMIEQDYQNKTVLISAHRASSVAFCDEIIYLQDGEIIERGSFEELMALKGRYYQIYSKQSAYSDISVEEENAVIAPNDGGNI